MVSIFQMISKNLIFSLFVVFLGYYFDTKICEAILVGNELNPVELYRMDLEIFKHIDRFYSVFRSSKVWKNFKLPNKVRSDFNFHVNDTIIPELKHYMIFFESLGPYFKNITLLYSVLYTKYTATFYSVNLLNIYKIEKKDNKEIAESYLKISQYLAWYAITGNSVIENDIQAFLSGHLECATKPYEDFIISYNKFLNGMYETFFKNDLQNEDTWTDIHNTFGEELEKINKYFAAILTGNQIQKIDSNDFIKKIEMESFFQSFASDLLAMKGRDIDETYYTNYDNNGKKDMFEANVISVMWTVSNEAMRNDLAKAQKKDAENNKKFLVLVPVASIYTCFELQLIDYEAQPDNELENPGDELPEGEGEGEGEDLPINDLDD